MIGTGPSHPEVGNASAPRLATAGSGTAGGGGPWRWYEAREVRRLFGPGKAGGRLYERFCHDVTEAEPQKLDRADAADGAVERKPGSGHTFREDLLIDRGPHAGRMLGELLNCSAYRSIPAEVKRAGRTTRERDGNLRELCERDRQFQVAHAHLDPDSRKYEKAFAKVWGRWAQEHRVSCKVKRLKSLRRAILNGDILDGRVNSGRKPKTYDERLPQCVRDLYLHANKFSVADAFEEQQRLAAALGVMPMSEYAVGKVIEDVPRGVKVLARHGERWKLLFYRSGGGGEP